MSAGDIGPQRGPASVAQVEAQSRAAKRLVGDCGIVYVGPFLLVDRSEKFRVNEWLNIVADGRGEVGGGDPYHTLLPQQPLGIARPLSFGRYDSHLPMVIARNDIEQELEAAYANCKPLIDWCSDNGVGCSFNWGVVQS